MIALLMAFAVHAASPEADDSEAPAAEGELERLDHEQPYHRVGWGFGGVPAVNYNSDEGFGFGVVGNLYRYDGGTAPYAFNVGILIFMTSKAVQSHRLELDLVEPGGSPLRVLSSLGLNVTRTYTYCGLGSAADCGQAQAALGKGASEEELSRYHFVRYVNPYGRLDVRYRVDPMPYQVEMMFGYRASSLLPGDFSVDQPWPNTLYERDFPGGEKGLISQLQAGVMLDNRDNEPAPIKGIWSELTVRAASKALGSTYEHFGYNLTNRTYLPLGTARLVWANRVVFDGLAGEAHLDEMGRVGGSKAYQVFGGKNGGRGIRQGYFVGRIKNMVQEELRLTYATAHLNKLTLDFGAVAFFDLGLVASDWDALDELGRPLVSEGVGLRFAMDKNFIVRADVGFSAIEDYAPGIYIDIANLF
jgi:hypothetical protein